MRKFHLLLFFILLVLPACGVNSLGQDEPLSPQYAYVVGKLSSKGLDTVWSNETDKINLQGSYAVYKVTPGAYTLSEFYMGGNSYRYTVMNPSFTVQAGKINFIGSISLNPSYANSTHDEIDGKNYVKANYPQLARNIEKDFIAVKLGWVEAKKR